jgi:hypothetical protein
LRQDDIVPYAAPILKLLQGVLTDTDDDIWRTLLNFQREVRLYLRQIGLELYVDERDGYAFLKQPREDEDENPINLPALTTRQRLSHLDTSLLLLLREALHEHEQRLTGDNLFVKFAEMRDWLLSFWKPQGNAKSEDNRIKTTINRLTDMGFLKKIDEDVYLVHRVIKAKLDSSQMLVIRDNLKAYYIQGRDNDGDEWSNN